jgi:hypothetical protein
MKNPLLLIFGGAAAYFLLRSANNTSITGKTSQVTLTGVRINTKNI